jgi:hypothetical protein
MSYKPSLENKKLAKELANSIADNQYIDLNLDEIIEKLKFERKKSKVISDFSDKIIIDEETHVGIWKKEGANNKISFVRDSKYFNEFYLWAKVHKIPSKSDKYRVVLLGESVARGYLYDPVFNPSKSLAMILDKNKFNSEVIDLARIGCGIDILSKTTNECMQLEPDAIIIFAGNNWSSDINVSEKEFGSFIKESNNENIFDFMKEILELKYKKIIESYFEILTSIKEVNPRIKIYVIIPEFNIKDWRSNTQEQILMFPYGTCKKWKEKLSLLDDSNEMNVSERIKICNELISINKSNPIPNEILGDIYLSENDTDNAEICYRAAHDKSIFQTFHNPGILSISQETLKGLCTKYCIDYIDSAEIIREFKKNGIADREYFLDYCHLTSEGTNILMYKTAQLIIRDAKQGDLLLSLDDLNDFGPKNETKAVAHFFAAIHNAHWGQKSNIVYYHCSKALEYNKALSGLMINYLHLSNDPCPWAISKYFEEIFRSGVLNQYYLERPKGLETMDLTLIEAITKALKDNNIDLEQNINTSRINKFSFNKNKIDLLESYYWLDYNLNQFTNNTQKSFYNERNFITKIYLVTSKESSISLEIVLRNPNKNLQSDIVFELNGCKVYSAEPTKEWSRNRFDLPSDKLVDGINNIQIHWPLITNSNYSEELTEEIDTYKFMDFIKPRYGEIFSFIAHKN